MTYDPSKHHRRSIRLQGYDYTAPGAYFVTICTQDRACLFGHVIDNAMHLNDAGSMLQAVWNDLPIKFPSVQLDAFQVMPNHIHLVVVLTEVDGDLERPSLPQIMQWYKSFTTTKYRHGVLDRGWMAFNDRLWQRNYYEHIISNQRTHEAIRTYVNNNPSNWNADQDHPQNW